MTHSHADNPFLPLRNAIASIAARLGMGCAEDREPKQETPLKEQSSADQPMHAERVQSRQVDPVLPLFRTIHGDGMHFNVSVAKNPKHFMAHRRHVPVSPSFVRR